MPALACGSLFVKHHPGAAEAGPGMPVVHEALSSLTAAGATPGRKKTSDRHGRGTMFGCAWAPQ